MTAEYLFNGKRISKATHHTLEELRQSFKTTVSIGKIVIWYYPCKDENIIIVWTRGSMKLESAFRIEKFSTKQLNKIFQLGLSEEDIIHDLLSGEFYNREFKISVPHEYFISDQFSFLP